MGVGQNIKDEFIEKFQTFYKRFESVCDLEINRYGNLIEGQIVEGSFILNFLNLYKKEDVSKEVFEKIIGEFRTNCDIIHHIVFATMGNRVFEIGDGDDIMAVEFVTINDKLVAKVWLRWWEDGG